MESIRWEDDPRTRYVLRRRRMPVISVYNNKGGVGKSTLTVGLAEFLAANRRKSVLVIDLDAQASCTGALLGRLALTQAIRARRTVPRLFGEVISSGKAPRDLSGFVTDRPGSATRGTALERIAVIVPDKPGMLEVEERIRPPHQLVLLRDRLKPTIASSYAFTLIDLPGNIDQRSKLAVAALIMSDFVLIPVEPSQIALNALPDTFDLIHYCRELSRTGRPAIVGLVLNKTDKRTEQYRSKFQPILEAANRGELPPVFENVIPDTPKLASATDETCDFSTLKDRFDTYYDHVRKVARELEERCEKYSFRPYNGSASEFGGWFRNLFSALAGRKKGKTAPAARST
jgi:chromosome partitioning protein